MIAVGRPLRAIIMQKMQTPTSVGAIGGWGDARSGPQLSYGGERPRFYDVNKLNSMTRHDWFILVTMVGLPLCLSLYAIAELYAHLDEVIIKFW
jgi:hypothetical protein